MLKDVTEKQKEKGLGGVRRALSGIPAPGYPENSNERSRGPQTNAMDVDEQNENFKGKNRKCVFISFSAPVLDTHLILEPKLHLAPNRSGNATDFEPNSYTTLYYH